MAFSSKMKTIRGVPETPPIKLEVCVWCGFTSWSTVSVVKLLLNNLFGMGHYRMEIIGKILEPINKIKKQKLTRCNIYIVSSIGKLSYIEYITLLHKY